MVITKAGLDLNVLMRLFIDFPTELLNSSVHDFVIQTGAKDSVLSLYTRLFTKNMLVSSAQPDLADPAFIRLSACPTSQCLACHAAKSVQIFDSTRP